MKKLVYHYTTFEALSGILGEEICLWATRYDHLNDPSEQVWARDNILKAIAQSEEYKNDTMEELKKEFDQRAFTISLCRKGDYRDMWRWYSKDGGGVCLGLDYSFLKRHLEKVRRENMNDCFDILSEVEYSSSENIEKVVQKCLKKKCFNNYGNEDKISHQLRVAPFIKNDDFKHEYEIRYARIRGHQKITVFPPQSDNKDCDLEFHPNENGLRIRLRGNEVVPYLEIKFPPSALKEIIVGYNVDFQKAKDFIENVLGQANSLYNKVNVRRSNLVSSQNQEHPENQYKQK